MTAASDRVTFEGRRTTRRTVAMLQAARTDFQRRTGRPGPAISQGGYNSGGVAASAGTHDRDAFDFATAAFSAGHCREWEASLGRVGFAAWWRRVKPGTWPQHHHGVPKGGDLSRGASNQVSSYWAGRDGLAAGRPYPGIRPFRGVTWESYVASQPKPVRAGYVRIGKVDQKQLVRMSVASTNRGRARGTAWRETYYVQRWLTSLGLYRGPLDGRWGNVTQAAFDRFRRGLGWPARDCVGPVGITSLTRLARAGKSTIPVIK